MDYLVGDNEYRAGKINCFKQFHIARRLAPLIGSLAHVDVKNVMDSKDVASMEPLLEAIAAMPDSDVNYIMDACLKATQRKDGNSWHGVLAPNGQMMFEDIGMGELMMICANTIKANLAGFMQGLPSGLMGSIKDLGLNQEGQS